MCDAFQKLQLQLHRKMNIWQLLKTITRLTIMKVQNISSLSRTKGSHSLQLSFTIKPILNYSKLAAKFACSF